jgi:hypothetical protein
MELDFSDKIKELLFSKKGKDNSKSGAMPFGKDEPEEGETKKHEKSETPDTEKEEDKTDKKSKAGKMPKEDESKETPDDESKEDTKAEKMCPDCGKPESKCECSDETKAGKTCAKCGKSMAKCSCASKKAWAKVNFLLQDKVAKFNDRMERQISLDQLSKVFARGLEESELNYRPGRSSVEWAFARVNAFLRMASNSEVNPAYAKADSDILSGNEISENYSFSNFQEIEFQLAKLSCIEAGLTDSELELSLSEDKKKIKL